MSNSPPSISRFEKHFVKEILRFDSRWIFARHRKIVFYFKMRNIAKRQEESENIDDRNDILPHWLLNPEETNTQKAATTIEVFRRGMRRDSTREVEPTTTPVDAVQSRQNTLRINTFLANHNLHNNPKSIPTHFHSYHTNHSHSISSLTYGMCRLFYSPNLLHTNSLHPSCYCIDVVFFPCSIFPFCFRRQTISIRFTFIFTSFRPVSIPSHISYTFSYPIFTNKFANTTQSNQLTSSTGKSSPLK